MGIGFVIFIWFVFFLTFAGIHIVLKHFAKGTFLEDIVKAVMMVFVTFAIFMGCFTVGTILLDRFCSSCVFYSSFGFFPTNDIQNLSGQKFAFGDAGQANLRFKADKKTVEKIISENLFLDRFKESFVKSEDVNLKEFAVKPKTKFYQSPKLKMGFGNGQATLVYDEESGEVYFYNYGVD
jgi:hypothetical protein